MYNPAPTTTNQVAPVKGRWPLGQRGSKIFKFFAIILVTTLLYFLTIIISTILGSFSENISFAGVRTTFDPLITIAYVLVFYSVSHYYSLTKKQAYNYLLLALFLSFTINFVEGSMVLVFLAPALRKLKLIDEASV